MMDYDPAKVTVTIQGKTFEGFAESFEMKKSLNRDEDHFKVSGACMRPVPGGEDKMKLDNTVTITLDPPATTLDDMNSKELSDLAESIRMPGAVLASAPFVPFDESEIKHAFPGWNGCYQTLYVSVAQYNSMRDWMPAGTPVRWDHGLDDDTAMLSGNGTSKTWSRHDLDIDENGEIKMVLTYQFNDEAMEADHIRPMLDEFTHSAAFQLEDGTVIELPAPEGGGWAAGVRMEYGWPHLYCDSVFPQIDAVNQSASFHDGHNSYVISHHGGSLLINEYRDRMETEPARVLWTQEWNRQSICEAAVPGPSKDKEFDGEWPLGRCGGAVKVRDATD